ncbi:MAG: DUF86 domain-containing protein [Bacteroidales bacterium]|nr:DUF86 domain-containing protein [Bacteroidales bacterium]
MWKAKNLVIALAMSIFFNEADVQNNQFILGVLILYWYENARQIVDTRNWVIHGYDRVDDVIIWGIISIHLPKLKKEIEDLLAKE